jgi:N-acetylglutamate synthase-like GNAT family acetyltransferase
MSNYRAYMRKATKKDCKRLAKIMRESDRKEVMASHGHTPYEALLKSFKGSDSCDSIVYLGKVVGMCGVARVDKLVGTPWLLGSDTLVTNKIVAFSFLKGSTPWVRKHQLKYPMLINYVSAENKASLMWLKHLGFTFIREVNIGAEPFYEFIRIRDYV